MSERDQRVADALEMLRQAGYGGMRVYVPARNRRDVLGQALALKGQGLSQQQIARKLGISQSAVSRTMKRARASLP